MPVVYVSVDAALYNQIVLHLGSPDADASALIDVAVRDYLHRTGPRASTEDRRRLKEYGDPASGYHWHPLFLPNGTKLSMKYRGQQHHAEVRHDEIRYEGRSMNPSELASLIASHTTRNAWRDLWIKRPNDQNYQLADVLRRQIGERKAASAAGR